ncbi:MAG TPA: hypothetical protein VFY44_05405, partial [Thermoleophilaceae bacterium]|nr:hypothetical protein [Thermoleophilaceae bacterium]
VVPRTLLIALVMLVALPGVAQAAVSTGDEPEPANGLTPPTATQDPSISGSATVGQSLTANLGTWDSPPLTSVDLDHIWLRCSASGTGCAQVAGATPSYALTGADVGRIIKLRVRGTTQGLGSGYRERDATGVVISAAPVFPVAPSNVTPPTITGTAREGEVLTLNTGTWTGSDPITYAYGWARCSPDCRPVAATQRYRVTSADVGSQLAAVVSARNAIGTVNATLRTGAVAAKVASTTKLKRLSPFPLMLIDGRVAGRITSISTLRLRRVPGGATIGIRCAGRGCPFKRSTIKVRKGKSRTVALRRLQRRMRAGTTVVITVRKGETLGKYIRLRFRRGTAPARVDRCVAPKSSKPVKCS